MFGNKDATDAAFAKAKHVVKLRVAQNRLAPNAMEPRVAIGEYSRPTSNTRCTPPRRIRTACAWRCRTSSMCRRAQMRVVSPDVGGGFGLKGGRLSRRCAGAVGIEAARPAGEMDRDAHRGMLNDHHGRDMVIYGELALDENGKIVGLREKRAVQLGAYFVGAGMRPAPSRCASSRKLTTSRLCSSRSRACSPTRRRSGPIAAPGGRRRPISPSG